MRNYFPDKNMLRWCYWAPGAIFCTWRCCTEKWWHHEDDGEIDGDGWWMIMMLRYIVFFKCTHGIIAMIHHYLLHSSSHYDIIYYYLVVVIVFSFLSQSLSQNWEDEPQKNFRLSDHSAVRPPSLCGVLALRLVLCFLALRLVPCFNWLELLKNWVTRDITRYH